jgi:hypothetical protein
MKWFGLFLVLLIHKVVTSSYINGMEPGFLMDISQFSLQKDDNESGDAFLSFEEIVTSKG